MTYFPKQITKNDIIVILIVLYYSHSFSFQFLQFTLVSHLIEDICIFPLQYSCLENPMDGGAW